MGIYDDEKDSDKKNSIDGQDLAKDVGRQLKNHINSSDNFKSASIPSSNHGATGSANASNAVQSQSAQQATQAAAQGGSQAAGAASGEAAGVAAGAAGGGTSAGAAAGSVVPGLGTAIGAAVGKVSGDIAGNAAKNEAEKQAGHTLKQQSEEKVSKKSKDKLGKKDSAMADDDDIIVKIMGLIIAIFVILIMMIVVVVMTILLSIAGPVIALYTMVQTGIERCSDFFEMFDDTPTFSDICSKIIDDIKEAMKAAYNDTCYQEVYQIAIEQEYNIEKTMESYQETEFPYNFEEESCNVNFTEILNILTMSDKINCSVDAFEYSEFKELLQDKEFLRTLYDLKVEPVNYLLIELGEHESGTVDENGLITITNTQTGESRTYQGTKKIDYDTYGAVSVSKYPVKKVFDYFEVDPYAKNQIYCTMTNYNALGILNQTTRLYDKSVFWGTSYKSKLYEYERYTGEITSEEINVYKKDYIPYLDLTEPGEPMQIPLMIQGDPKWKTDYDGSTVKMNDGSTIARRGCCVTCMAMVCTYMTGVEVTPVDLIKCRVVTEGTINRSIYGPINRNVTARAYGFKENIMGKPTAQLLSAMCSELDMQHPIMLKMNTGVYKNISYDPNNPPTHFIVLTGWNAEEQCFYVNDPAGMKGYYGPNSKYEGKLPFELIIGNTSLFMEARSYSF